MRTTPALNIFDIRQPVTQGPIMRQEVPKSDYQDSTPVKVFHSLDVNLYHVICRPFGDTTTRPSFLEMTMETFTSGMLEAFSFFTRIPALTIRSSTICR